MRPALLSFAVSTGNPLITHQVEGLVDPFDPETSTVQTHWHLVVDGFKRSLNNPVGQGTGSINIAAQKLGGGDSETGTEVDISNAFVGFGLLGGLLFLAIVLVTFGKVFRGYLRAGDPRLLAVAGLLLIVFGQWLNGGQYAVASITWFLIGWATRPPGRTDATGSTAAARGSSGQALDARDRRYVIHPSQRP